MACVCQNRNPARLQLGQPLSLVGPVAPAGYEVIMGRTAARLGLSSRHVPTQRTGDIPITFMPLLCFITGSMEKRLFDVRSRTSRSIGGLIVAALLVPMASLAQDSPDIIWSQAQNSDRINAVIFSPDGNTVISGSSDRLINFWNASDGTLQRTLNANAASVHSSSVEALAISPDGARLASVAFQTVKLWRLSDGISQSLVGHQDWVVGCAYSPNGAYLATASFDGTVRVWRGSDGAALKILSQPGQVRAVAFSPDSTLVASGGGDNTLYIRNTSDWSVVQRLSGHSDDIDTIAFSPDGSLVATGSYDRTVRVWDPRSGSLKSVIGNNNGTIYSLAFSPNGSTLAYTDGEGNTIKLVRTSDGAVIHTYNANVTAVQTLAYSPSGTLAYGRIDKTVVLARVVGGGGPTNSTVSVSLLAPPAGHTFAPGTSITMSARPSSSAGVAQVEFFANDQSLGVVNASPWSMQWTNAAAGSYTITATATDAKGAAASDTVSISVADPPADQVRPRVAITSPPANSRFPTNTITLAGKASDNVGVNQVLVSLNSGDFQAADGTTTWTMGLQLTPGLNTVRVKSVDTSGNESSVASRSFTYIVTSSLNVTVSGNGTVTPNYAGKLLEAGKRYSLRAIPTAGNIFSGWTGDITTNVAAFSFVMPGNDVSVTANFVPNPFLPLVGTYRGLALSDPPAVEGTGYGQFTVTRSGAFTGTLFYERSVVPLSGTFLGDGSFSRTIPRRGKEPLDVELQLHLNDNSQQLTGTISNSVAVAVLTADLATFNARTNPAPQAGRYTFIMPPNTNGGGPQGTSFGTVVITPGGTVQVSGKLADGVAIAQSTTLSKPGTWPFFQQMAGGVEVLAGQVAVEEVAGVSDMDGTINWFRNASRSKLFPDGFTTQVLLIGSHYVPAVRGTPILGSDTNSGNVLVALQNGNLPSETDYTATLTLSDRLISAPATNRTVSATFSRATGLFSGAFRNPATSRSTPFSGALLQKQGLGAGFFLGTDQSGTVLIEAVPSIGP